MVSWNVVEHLLEASGTTLGVRVMASVSRRIHPKIFFLMVEQASPFISLLSKEIGSCLAA